MYTYKYYFFTPIDIPCSLPLDSLDWKESASDAVIATNNDVYTQTSLDVKKVWFGLKNEGINQI